MELYPKLSDALMQEMHEFTLAAHSPSDHMYDLLSSAYERNDVHSFLCHYIEWRKKSMPKLYHYFVTFTHNPSADKDRLRKLIIEKLPYRQSLAIINFEYTEEHVNTNYHIHAIITTRKPMKKDRLAPYKKYGHIDYQPCRSINDAYTYINKENPSHTIVP